MSHKIDSRIEELFINTRILNRDLKKLNECIEEIYDQIAFIENQMNEICKSINDNFEKVGNAISEIQLFN